jgi:hypothetical protein
LLQPLFCFYIFVGCRRWSIKQSYVFYAAAKAFILYSCRLGARRSKMKQKSTAKSTYGSLSYLSLKLADSHSLEHFNLRSLACLEESFTGFATRALSRVPFFWFENKDATTYFYSKIVLNEFLHLPMREDKPPRHKRGNRRRLRLRGFVFTRV